jgi:hypothetical protein
MNELKCCMMLTCVELTGEDVECGKPANRRCASGSDDYGCCDDCFNELVAEDVLSVAKVRDL